MLFIDGKLFVNFNFFFYNSNYIQKNNKIIILQTRAWRVASARKTSVSSYCESHRFCLDKMAALSSRLTPFHEESVVVMNSFPKSSFSQQQTLPADHSAIVSFPEDNAPAAPLFNDEPKFPVNPLADHDTEDERSGKGNTATASIYDSELDLPDTASRESSAPKSPRTAKKRLLFTKEEDDSIISVFSFFHNSLTFRLADYFLNKFFICW